MKTTPTVVRSLAAAAAIAGTAFVLAAGRGPDAATASSRGEDAEASAAAVTVVKPQRQTLEQDLVLPASLMPYEAVDLYAKASGYVSRVAVDIGDRVRAGDVLVEIDIPEMADELRQAEARLEARRAAADAMQAKADQAMLFIEAARAEARRAEADAELKRITCRRKQELFAVTAIPEQERDEAQGMLAVAEASLEIERQNVASREAEATVARAQVKVAAAEAVSAEADVQRLRTLMRYSRITSPCDGVITRRHVDPGAFVRSAASASGSPLLSLATTQRLRLVFEVPETQAPYVRPGSAVTVRLPALGSEPIEAKVARTAGALNPQTRTMRLEVDLDNHDGALLPGLYAQATVALASVEAALMIPSKAVRARGGRTFVLVAKGGVAEAVTVTLGYDDGVRAHITSGLQGEESIITEASSAVGPGSAVRAMAAAHTANARMEG